MPGILLPQFDDWNTIPEVAGTRRDRSQFLRTVFSIRLRGMEKSVRNRQAMLAIT